MKVILVGTAISNYEIAFKGIIEGKIVSKVIFDGNIDLNTGNEYMISGSYVISDRAMLMVADKVKLLS